jgi:uncharacterized protein DUF1549/uncharacterized protein DUF1553/cytochrome c
MNYMKSHIAFLAAAAQALCISTVLAAAATTDDADADAPKPAVAEKPPTAEEIAFFEKKIRPVLADKCYKCHSEKAEKIRGGLLLDTRAGARRGGDDGPAVVPGDLDQSLLIQAIRYTNEDTAMPPKKNGGKLPDDVIKDFEAWVKMGAPDPREGAAKVVKKYDTSEAKNWWAFQQPTKQPAPQPHDAAWAKTDIDRFLLAAMEAKGIKPVADADKATLIRRVYFDLIGLPPSVKEADAFLRDTSPNAFEKIVDRLLASPQFGERWGRHWLDVARYAESTGKDVNIAFPQAWRYRDYVIDSFNKDKPYDEFIREQIAGDSLPAKNEKERADHIIATGFLAIGPKGLNEQNPRQFVLDLADEQIDTMSQSILGMTVACARCHDHKFDPIPQREYYALAGIFTSTDTKYGTPFGIQNRHATELLELPKGAGEPVVGKTMTAAERQQKQQKLDELQKDIREMFAGRAGQGKPGQGANPAQNNPQINQRRLFDIAQAGMLDAELKSHDESGQPKALAMGAKDLPATGGQAVGAFFRGLGQGGGGGLGARLRARPPEFSTIGDCAVYARGDVEKPGDKAPRGFPASLTPSTAPEIPRGESGRKELADWLTSSTNPLTSRVMTNRIWHWLFGRGIVESVDNFGNMGQKPSNQALLDSLAIEFEANGWSVKKMIREIVLSHAYQLGSTFDDKDFHADPENALVWRMSKRRLDAECIRDAMLAVSGQLSSPPTGSLIAQAGDGPIGGQARRLSSISEESIVNANGNYRSVYLPIARDVLPDALAVFDFAEPSLVTGSREVTNVPSQALFVLNSSFVADQSRKLAESLINAYPAGPNGGVTANYDQRLTWAYWLVFSRPPSTTEKRAALNFLTRYPAQWSKETKSASASGNGKSGGGVTSSLLDQEGVKAAWTSLCRALFASAEFRYVN